MDYEREQKELGQERLLVNKVNLELTEVIKELQKEKEKLQEDLRISDAKAE